MGWGTGGQGGQREMRLQERKGENYSEKHFVKEVSSVFSPGLQKHMDFLVAQRQDPIQSEWSTSVLREQIL